MKKKPTWEKQENMNFQNARIVKLKIEFVELEYNLKTEPKLPLTLSIRIVADCGTQIFQLTMK